MLKRPIPLLDRTPEPWPLTWRSQTTRPPLWLECQHSSHAPCFLFEFLLSDFDTRFWQHHREAEQCTTMGSFLPLQWTIPPDSWYRFTDISVLKVLENAHGPCCQQMLITLWVFDFNLCMSVYILLCLSAQLCGCGCVSLRVNRKKVPLLDKR